MKSQATCLTLVILMASAQAEERLPYDVQKLITQRAQAIEEIDRTYIQELEKLKLHYTRQGNLEVANAIVSIIEDRRSVHTEKPASPDPIVGIWRWPNGTHAVFYPDGSLYSFNTRGRLFKNQWKFTSLGEKYRFTWYNRQVTGAVMEDGELRLTGGPENGKKALKVK